MALSMPPPHAMWDGTLPSPTALLSIRGDPQRSSSYHHIASNQVLKPPFMDESGRRSTTPCISTPENKSKAQAEVFVEDSEEGSAISVESMEDRSSEGASPSESQPGYCLCVPEPKIPRPRNAFILYRQHQHAPVVASNPGLPNPEISKIIGEQWRLLPVKEKEEWKTLAEQEKDRHSQQFPNYRYRPKRSSKFQPTDSGQLVATRSTSCAKCGGKTMNPPHTPQHPSFDVRHHANAGMQRVQKRAFTEAHVQPPRAQPMAQIVPHPQTAPIRYSYQPRNDSVHYVQTLPGPQHAPHPPQQVHFEGPEAKRRRMNSAYPSRPSYNHQYYEQGRTPSQYHPEQIARHPMPPPQRIAQPPPPLSAGPRPISVSHQRRDPGLILPPLKTDSPPRSAMTSNTQTQKSGIEAIIMSYPVLQKLGTIRSITPSLPAAGSASPPHCVRGAIIAIEGLDQRKVQDMTTSLAEQLEKEGRFQIRIFVGPNPYQALQASRRASIGQGGEAMTTEKYLNLISQWHKVSKDMVDFVTQKPKRFEEIRDREMADASANDDNPPRSPFHRSPSKRSPISAISPGTIEQAAGMDIDTPQTAKNTDDASARITRSTIPQAMIEHKENVIASPPPPPLLTERPCTPPPPSLEQEDNISNLIPIALVPHYELTTVDACSIAVPIIDKYDPLTHWRWHATLWRGCAGPDISIVIKSPHDQHEDDASADAKKLDGSALPPHARTGSTAGMIRAHDLPASSAAPPPTPAAPSAAVAAPFGVEVRLQDHRAVIVRAGPTSRTSNANELVNEKDLEKEKENWEKAKRRVGFEVEESLRR